MGWFLTRKKATTSKRRKPAVPVRPDWDPQRTLAAVRTLVSITVVVGLGAGWYYGQQHLRRYVSHHASVLVTPQQVDLVNAPPWMSPRLREEIQAQVAGRISPDPLDQSGLAQASAILRINPWVASVQQLHRVPSGRVQVVAQYRQPIALVVHGEGYHLVDVQGVRLPGVYQQSHVKALKLPVITGVSATPGDPGRVWPGQDLQAGLSLVQLLGGESYMPQVSAIDVGQRDARGRIRLALHTHAGGVVHWGLPPGQEQAVESPAATKKRWIASLNQQRGSIDAGGKVVSLYGAAVFVHTPADDQSVQLRYTWSQ